MENWIPWRFRECFEFLVLFCQGKRKTTYNSEQYEVVWGSIFLGINVKLASVSKASDTDHHLFTQTELKEDIVFFRITWHGGEGQVQVCLFTYKGSAFIISTSAGLY